MPIIAHGPSEPKWTNCAPCHIGAMARTNEIPSTLSWNTRYLNQGLQSSKKHLPITWQVLPLSHHKSMSSRSRNLGYYYDLSRKVGVTSNTVRMCKLHKHRSSSKSVVIKLCAVFRAKKAVQLVYVQKRVHTNEKSFKDS